MNAVKCVVLQLDIFKGTSRLNKYHAYQVWVLPILNKDK